MTIVRFGVFAALALALAGCAASWSKGGKVEFANSSSITISTDPAFTDLADAQKVAQEHCDKYGEDAIPQASVMNGWGLRSFSFVSQKRD